MSRRESPRVGSRSHSRLCPEPQRMTFQLLAAMGTLRSVLCRVPEPSIQEVADEERASGSAKQWDGT